MSAEVVSRVTAMLALDGNLLAEYLPDPALGAVENAKRRQDFVKRYEHLLTPEEVTLLVAGDFAAFYAYLGANLPKPVGGDETGGGGGG